MKPCSRKQLLEYIEKNADVLVVNSSRPYSYTHIAITIDGVTFVGDGYAKVCYPDRFDPEVGIDIALSRAIIDVYRRIRKMGLCPYLGAP